MTTIVNYFNDYNFTTYYNNFINFIFSKNLADIDYSENVDLINFYYIFNSKNSNCYYYINFEFVKSLNCF